MQAALLRQENSMCILIFASNVACASYFLLEASENAMFHEPHLERNRLNRIFAHTKRNLNINPFQSHLTSAQRQLPWCGRWTLAEAWLCSEKSSALRPNFNNCQPSSSTTNTLIQMANPTWSWSGREWTLWTCMCPSVMLRKMIFAWFVFVCVIQPEVQPHRNRTEICHWRQNAAAQQKWQHQWHHSKSIISVLFRIETN